MQEAKTLRGDSDAEIEIVINKQGETSGEVPKAQIGRVPEDYVRRQTLVNAERYITEELKEFEARVARADEAMTG